MPFVTEELYQRLPRRSTSIAPSIVVADYPDVGTFSWKRDEAVERDVTFMQDIIHNVRSLRSEYNLVKQKVKLYIKCDGDATSQRLKPFLQTIEVLSSSSAIEELAAGASPPVGSAIVPISETCEAYLLLKGVVDVKKETERLNGKKDKIDGPIKKLRESIAASDYLDKVPAEVREANDQKLKLLEGELSKVCQAIKTVSLID